MDPITTTQEVIHDFLPLFRVYRDGRIDRRDSPLVPPSTDSITGVQSKDVVISSEPKVSARLYLPKSVTTDHCKLPLLIYIHGGGFVIESAFSIFYHTHVNALAAAANAVVVSVEYRRALEDPIPACYEDCWTALKWVADDQVCDPWINEYADLGRVFFAGDSAGANIAHNILVRVGVEGLDSRVNVEGMILVHPSFGMDNVPNKLWTLCCPDTSGVDDPRFYPSTDLNLLAKIGCGKVLVCLASKDFLVERGRNYYEALKNSEWGGVVEIMETEGEGHVFHLLKPTDEKTGSLVTLMASFIKGGH